MLGLSEDSGEIPVDWVTERSALGIVTIDRPGPFKGTSNPRTIIR